MKRDNGKQQWSEWTQQLHDKLAEHETAAPEGLWADIEAALQAQPLPRKSRFVAWRRWAAAAAVALLAVGGTGLWWATHDSSDTAALPQSAPQYASHVREDTQPCLSPPDEDVAETGTTAMTATKLQRPPTAQPESVAEPLAMEEAAAAVAPVQETVAAVKAEATDTPTKRPYMSEETSHTTAVEPYTPIRGNMRPATGSKRQLSIGLYTMNGLASYDGSNGVRMADHLAKNYYNTFANSYALASRATEPIYLTGYEERQNHHRPVSFGLTIGYPLTDRLALTTGMVYTKQTSDFTQMMRSQQIEREQTLYYVGLPLAVSYRLWRAGGFRVYASAGATALWNVGTRLATEGVDQETKSDHMQWSLSGSLGVQYDVMPLLGLYAEPGVSYYPDNGSTLQNYFKDKPVNVSLQVGLRFNLDR